MTESSLGSGLGAKDYTAKAVPPAEFPDEHKRQTALWDIINFKLLSGTGGQRLSGIYTNRSADGIPIVRLNAFNGDSTKAQQQYTAYQYAASNPGNPILQIDLPSHGYSDRLSVRQRLELLSKKTLGAVAASQAVAIADFMPNREEFVLVGDSVAGLLAMEVAIALKKLGLYTRAVLGYDPVGFSTRSDLSFHAGIFKARGQNRHRRYHEGAANQRLDKSYEAFKDELKAMGYPSKSYSPVDVYRKDPLLMPVMFRSPLSSEAGYETLTTLMEDTAACAAFVSGSLSQSCPYDKIHPRLIPIARKYEDRIRWDVWPGDSHSMGIAEQQPRFASYTGAVLKRLGLTFT